MTNTVYLGLGSNVGDRRGHIRQALEQLDRVPGLQVLAVSELRETAPVGGPPQGDYLNGVARLACRLEPAALLQILKQVELAAGRDLGAPRNSPRPLDLDILLFGDLQVCQQDLVIPHPRLAEREFVLEPLRELGVDTGALPAPARPLVQRSPAAFVELCSGWLRSGAVTGLVPTMGALHEGHASLLRTARQECDLVAATIFVNPLQFGPGEDYERYPRTLAADLEVLCRCGADAVFVPAAAEIYGEGFASRIAVGREAEGLEAGTRPGHFSGVATVVARLLAMARPSRAYFGRKDAQQVGVIRRMVLDLGFPVEVRECPTVREPDGLAMSSRNAYLRDKDRQAAPTLYRALTAMRNAHRQGERDAAALLAVGRALLDRQPRLRVDYLELRREPDLGPLPPGPVAGGRILVAAFVGEDGPRPVRLIDNMSLLPEDSP